MEESTCHKIVIVLLKRFSYIKCLFLLVFISFKHDFHNCAESMIIRNKYLQIYKILMRRENLSIFYSLVYTYFIATNYSNGVGSQVLATLVTTLPLHTQINQSM